ncbi:hypothetical protein LCGC14_0970980 [marine sediment metagenome]|uniref:IrrE N-terminal-like domain-containing protein n=1 Tax=marine sediment metagenome TaxID=412755 RepID=A0A0F9NBS9_9ZZZZ
MRVKIPREIKISIYPYSVKLVPHLKLEEGNWGTTNFVRRTLGIDSDLPLLERNQTLLHEVFHIISASFLCGLDEDNVERLANGIGELLFDNLGIEFDWSGIRE